MFQHPVAVGQPAPAFVLKDPAGKDVGLKDMVAKGCVVVFFYPKNGTPGCTKEACAFRDSYDAFVSAGCSVVGISSDAAASHQQFRDKHGLPFVLLTDEGGKTAAAYGIGKTLGLLPGRATFVIDRKGVVQHHFVSLFGVDKHVSEALRVVKTLP